MLTGEVQHIHPLLDPLMPSQALGTARTVPSGVGREEMRPAMSRQGRSPEESRADCMGVDACGGWWLVFGA